MTMTPEKLNDLVADALAKVSDLGTVGAMKWLANHALAERAPEPQGQALPEFADAVKQLRSALSAMMTQFGMDEDETSAGTFKQARKAYEDTANMPDFAALYGETAVQNAELRIAIGAFGLTHEQAVQRASQLALPAGTFQQRVRPWMMACFGEAISNDLQERNHRFLEEALELVQSTGCTQSEAHQLVDYVFGRPVGEPAQEVGGVMVTLAALCLAAKMDMHAAGETELARIWTKVDQIRAKRAAKPKHSPLPVALPAGPVPLDVEVILDMMRQHFSTKESPFSGSGTIVQGGIGSVIGFAHAIRAMQPSPAVAQPVADERALTSRHYRKKPVVIQAVQWTGDNLYEVIAFTDGPPDIRSMHASMKWDEYRDLVARDGLMIFTLEGKMLANVGDWIIKGVKGEHYPCKPDVFAATYEPARATLSQPAEAKPTDCSGDPQCCPQNEGYGCDCSALAAEYRK